MQKHAWAAIPILFAATVHAQHPPAFDVASVKVSQLGQKGGEGSAGEDVAVSPTSLTMRNVTLRTCIRWAYGVRDFQIAAPGRLGSERYDILAKTSDPVPPERLRLMLRGLLQGRFELKLHREHKEVPVYVMTVAQGGARLQRSTSEAPGGLRPKDGGLEFHNMSMGELAERLAARPFGFDRPVVDRTGLDGAYDFTMKLAESNAELKSNLEHAETERDVSAFVVQLRDLGLRLKAEKDPVEVLVVDHVEKVPAEQ